MTMKKIVSLLLVLVSLIAVAIPACASGKTLYDADKVQIVVISWDAEKDAPYTGVYALKTAAKLATENNLCEAYGFECDALVRLTWTIDGDGKVTFVNTVNGEMYAEYTVKAAKTTAKKAK